MRTRVPPNKGIVQFPAVMHFRCNAAMLAEIKSRGGSNWLRALVAANARPPSGAPQTAPVFDGEYGGEIPAVPAVKAKRSRRVTSRARSSKRVTLDKRKRAAVKSRVSRVA